MKTSAAHSALPIHGPHIVIMSKTTRRLAVAPIALASNLGHVPKKSGRNKSTAATAAPICGVKNRNARRSRSAPVMEDVSLGHMLLALAPPKSPIRNSTNVAMAATSVVITHAGMSA